MHRKINHNSSRGSYSQNNKQTTKDFKNDNYNNKTCHTNHHSHHKQYRGNESQHQSAATRRKNSTKKPKWRKVIKSASIELSPKVFYFSDYFQSICSFLNFFDLHQTVCRVSKFHHNFINNYNNKLLQVIFNQTFPNLLNKLDIGQEKLNQNSKEQLCKLLKDWEFTLQTVKASKYLYDKIKTMRLKNENVMKRGETRDQYVYHVGILLILDNFIFVKYWLNKLLVNVKSGEYHGSQKMDLNKPTAGGKSIHNHYATHYSQYPIVTRLKFSRTIGAAISLPISIFCSDMILKWIIVTIGRAGWNDDEFKKFVDWFFDTITKNKIKQHFSDIGSNKGEKYMFFGRGTRNAIMRLIGRQFDKSSEYFRDLTKVIYVLNVMYTNPCCIVDMKIFLARGDNDINIFQFYLRFIHYLLFSHKPEISPWKIREVENQWRKCMKLPTEESDHDHETQSDRPKYYDEYAEQTMQILNLLDKFIQKSLLFGNDLRWNTQARIRYQKCIAIASNSHLLYTAIGEQEGGLQDYHAIQLILRCRSKLNPRL